MENDNKKHTNNSIKNVKPRKNSYYNQGVVDPHKCKKYYNSCKDEPIIYRSGVELQFIHYCENNSNIAKWASEPIGIKYICALDNKEHQYYPDYIIENKNGTRCIVEVKPYAQTKKPKQNDSRWLKEQWVKNMGKWAAAKKFAEQHGMKFIIVTENFFK